MEEVIMVYIIDKAFSRWKKKGFCSFSEIHWMAVGWLQASQNISIVSCFYPVSFPTVTWKSSFECLAITPQSVLQMKSLCIISPLLPIISATFLSHLSLPLSLSHIHSHILIKMTLPPNFPDSAKTTFFSVI